MKYVIANWKMKMSRDDVLDWAAKFKTEFSALSEKDVSGVQTILAPTALHLSDLQNSLKDLSKNASTKVNLATQNVSADSKGSHTGEIGAFQVKDYCKYSIVGHSERAEAPALVAAKRDKALEHGITPIICFTSPEQAEFFYKEGVILAWEDPQNISAGGEYKKAPIAKIKETVTNMKNSLPKGAIVLYGGSVNKDNVSDLAAIEALDGVLVGQASLDPYHFLELVKSWN
ncbi:hypothetical protein GF360_00640 [candidate division WWE3 bacterium]|nr:hypothetical protein [candidate division WWE3 bacterium]